MGAFFTDVIQRSPWFHEARRVCSDPALLEPGFRAKVATLIADGRASGYDLRILETFRSQTRQSALYAQGRTAPGHIVTSLSRVGVHGYGLACDIGLFKNDAKHTYDATGEDYRFFLALCARHRLHTLVSGIDWGLPGIPHGFRDWDHVQGVPLFRQPALFAGTWYPPADYDPVQDEVDHHITGAPAAA